MPLRRLPSLSGIRAFEAAARRGSFKAAAEELSVTPGAVSQHIKALEADLGVALFTRKTRAVELTSAGQSLQPTLSEAFLSMRQALDKVRPSTGTTLRINSSGPILSKWLLPRLHEFTSLHPKLQVFIDTEFALTEPDTDDAEILIRYAPTPPQSLDSALLHEELLVPVARTDLLDRYEIKTVQDVTKAPILHDTSLLKFGARTGWDVWAEEAGMPMINTLSSAITFEPHAADQVVDAAIAGAGLALARSLLVADALSRGALMSPFGPVVPSGVNYYVCCPIGRDANPYVESFFLWVRVQAEILTTLNGLCTE